MKKQYLRLPAPGRGQTCAITHQHYVPARRRTEQDWLGSFALDADPALLPQGIRLSSRATMEGRPVTLADLDIDDIRAFLVRHGTRGQGPTLGARVTALLTAATALRDALRATPTKTAGSLSADEMSAWRMLSFAMSEVVEQASRQPALARPKGWQTAVWAPEAAARGYASRKKT